MSQPFSRKLQLGQQLTRWSDHEGYRQAIELAESFRNLLPSPVTPSQLHGLRNIATAADNPGIVLRYTEHQGKKAEKRGDLELRNYWKEVGKRLSDLSGTAKHLASETLGEETESKQNMKAYQDDIHLRLIKIIAQHLVVHSLYIPREKISN